MASNIMAKNLQLMTAQVTSYIYQVRRTELHKTSHTNK